MEIDKRPFYIWLAVIVENIALALAIVFAAGLENLSDLLEEPVFYVAMCISIVISAVPVIISQSNSRFKNHFGYGIPLLLLLPLPLLMNDYSTCNDIFCGLGPFLVGIALALSASIFAIFYAISVYARKWNIKFIIYLVGIEIVLFGAIIAISYFASYNLT
jgi:hypothetical protein